MENIYIRKIEESDLDDALKLYQQVSNIHSENRPDIFVKEAGNHHSNYFSKIIHDNNTLATVAEINNEIVGLCIGEIQITLNDPLIHDSKTIYISAIVVSKDHKRKGIGKKLYYDILERGKYLKIDKIELVVWDFNKSAMEFYQSLGFKNKYHMLEKEI